MATKNALLEMFGKTLANEDEFIINYGKAFLEGINNTRMLKDDEKKEITDILGTMLEDTERHARTIKALQDEIRGGKRNEF